MANFFKDNEDLQYYFDKGIDWEPLVRITEHDFSDADAGGRRIQPEGAPRNTIVRWDFGGNGLTTVHSRFPGLTRLPPLAVLSYLECRASRRPAVVSRGP